MHNYMTDIILFAVQFFLLMLMLWGVGLIYDRLNGYGYKGRKKPNNNSISKALLELPDALCFYTEEGEVIMANLEMRRLNYEICLKPLSDAGKMQ